MGKHGSVFMRIQEYKVECVHTVILCYTLKKMNE